MKEIYTPLDYKQISSLRAGDMVSLTGVIFTARDQAHKRLLSAINRKKSLPVDLSSQLIYYCGPTLTPRGQIIGSCGPTTSSRMDEFSPGLLKAGLSGMIGKGRRSPEVAAAIKKHRAVYFLTYAGCGALLSKYVKGKRLVAYGDLGPEAIYKLVVTEFPLIVGIDFRGEDIYKGKKCF